MLPDPEPDSLLFSISGLVFWISNYQTQILFDLLVYDTKLNTLGTHRMSKKNALSTIDVM